MATEMTQPEELTMKQIEELREAFELFDHDGNGCITSAELLTVMHRLRQQVSEAEIKEMIHQVDIDDEKPISYLQFVTLVLRIRWHDNLLDGLSEVFVVCDEDKDGVVNAQDIYWTLCTMGYVVTPQDIRKMVAEIRGDGDATLNKSEFVSMMQKKFTLSLTPCDIENITPNQQRDLFLGFHLIDRGKARLIDKAQADLVLGSLGHDFSSEITTEAYREICVEESTKLTHPMFLQYLGACIRLRAEDAEMATMFRAFDTDGNGYIDGQELAHTMKSLGMALTGEDVTNMMKEIGAQDTGRIYYRDFIKMMSGRLKQAKQMAADGDPDFPVENQTPDVAQRKVEARQKRKLMVDSPETAELRISFSIFDKNGDGHIERSEVVEVMKSMGITVDDQEIDEMIHSADKDGNGMIEFDEFCDMMGKSSGSGGPLLLPLRSSELSRTDSAKSRSSLGKSGYLTPDWAASDPDLLSEDELLEKFQLFDKDGDGFITEKDVRDTMRSLGMAPSAKDIKAMMKVAGVDKHGKIGFKGFAKMICGQFVDPSVVTQSKLTKSQTKELKVLFSLFDKNGDGSISVEEMESVLSTLRLPCDDNKLKAGFKQYDLDGNGQIDFQEFLQMMEKTILGQKPSSTSSSRRGRSSSTVSRHAEIQTMFTAFDKDNNGYIDAKELRNTMKELGVHLSARDTKEMIKTAGGHGRIYYEDFLRIMSNDGGPETKRFALLDDQTSTLAAPSTPDRSRASSGNSLTLPDYASLDVMDLQVSFALFDKNNDGNISCEEVMGVMRSMGLKVDEEKVKKMIDKVDTDGNGLIDFDEFHQMMLLHQRQSRSRSLSGGSNASSISVEDDDMQQLFHIFDRDGDGFINAVDIRDTMKELGVVLTNEDVAAMMSQAGVGPKGKLYYKDFCKVMQGQFRTPPGMQGQEPTPEQQKDLQTLFSLFDMNKDGFISLEEVMQASKMLGIFPKDPAGVKSMFNQVDLDGNGLIDFQEFAHLVHNYVIVPPVTVEAETQPQTAEISSTNSSQTPNEDPELMAMFRAFDEDGNGYIDSKELRNTMQKLGFKVREADIVEMLKEANAEDGKIFYNDFVRFMGGEIGQKQKTASKLFTDSANVSPMVQRKEDLIVKANGHRDPVTVQDLQTTFTLFDLDHDGLVGPDEVVEMMWAHDLAHVPNHNIINAVKEMDTGGGNRLNFEQFCQLFKTFHAREDSESPSSSQASSSSSPRFAQHSGTKPKDFTHKNKSHKAGDQDVILNKPGLPHIIVSKCKDMLPKIAGLGKKDKNGTSVYPGKNKGSGKDSKKSPSKESSNTINGHAHDKKKKKRSSPFSSPFSSPLLRMKRSPKSSPKGSPATSPSLPRNSLPSAEYKQGASSEMVIPQIIAPCQAAPPLGAGPSTRHSQVNGHHDASPTAHSIAKQPKTTCDQDVNLQSASSSPSRSSGSRPVQADVRNKVTANHEHSSPHHVNNTSQIRRMTSDDSRSTTSEDIPKSWTAFKMFDKNSNGYIDAGELDLAMRQMGVVLSSAELEIMLSDADLNGDGQIDYKEFKRLIHGALRRFENIAVDIYEKRRTPSEYSECTSQTGSMSMAEDTSQAESLSHFGSSSQTESSSQAEVMMEAERSLEASAAPGCTTGNGQVEFDEFITMMSQTKSARTDEEQRRLAEENEMRQAFKVFDIDGNGQIDAQELRTTMKNLGEELSEKDVKAMIKAADKNGDGKIDYEEFIKMMYGKTSS